MLSLSLFVLIFFLYRTLTYTLTCDSLSPCNNQNVTCLYENNNVCQIDCTGTNTCSNSNFYCELGLCKLNCNFASACTGITIYGFENQYWDVSCNILDGCDTIFAYNQANSNISYHCVDNACTDTYIECSNGASCHGTSGSGQTGAEIECSPEAYCTCNGDWSCHFLSYEPTTTPSKFPTINPTTSEPSLSPTLTPTNIPSFSPSYFPTKAPTLTPTSSPSKTPTQTPTGVPSSTPSAFPTKIPTNIPTTTPSNFPSTTPSIAPTRLTNQPSITPTRLPTVRPSRFPSESPTISPVSADSSTSDALSDTIVYSVCAGLIICICLLSCYNFYKCRQSSKPQIIPLQEPNMNGTTEIIITKKRPSAMVRVDSNTVTQTIGLGDSYNDQSMTRNSSDNSPNQSQKRQEPSDTPEMVITPKIAPMNQQSTVELEEIPENEELKEEEINEGDLMNGVTPGGTNTAPRNSELQVFNTEKRPTLSYSAFDDINETDL